MSIENSEEQQKGNSGDKEQLKQQIINALCTVYDPEIPVNIYELGLIYEVNIDDDNNVDIMMTLTSPACPVAGTLPVEVENRVKSVKETNNVKVELTFEPPWTMDMMSEEAKLELGML